MTDYRELAYSRYREDEKLDYPRYASAYARRVARRLRVEPGWKCLDIACGYGNFLAYLRSASVGNYLGVDTSEMAVKRAAREFGDARIVLKDAITFLREATERYDLISALDFVEHLRKDEVFEFLQAAAAVQTSGGRLLLRTPNANALFGMAARYNDITHEVCFTPNSLADSLARCGYEASQVWEDRPEPGSVMQTAHWAAWQVSRFFIRCADAAETGTWGDGVLTRNMWALARRR